MSATPAIEVKVIKPVGITDAMIVSLPLAGADQPEYSAGTAYAQDALVQVTAHRSIYRSVQGANTGNAPPAPGSAATEWWKRVGPMNRYAMFDASISTASVYAGTLMTLVLRPGQSIGGLAIFQVSAAQVNVKIDDAVTGLNVLNKAVAVSDGQIDNWYEWLTAPLDYVGDLFLLDLPLVRDPLITLTFSALTQISVGAVLLGSVYALGSPQYGMSARRVTTSVFSTDADGTTVDRRPTKRRAEIDMFFDAERLNKVLAFLDAVDSLTCAWIPVPLPGYESLAVLGWHQDAVISLPYESVHRCRLIIQGAP